jgi:hypothetical protein
MDNKRISSFKKFSELNEIKKSDNDGVMDSIPTADVAGTPIPNIPSDSTRIQKGQDTRYMSPDAQTKDGVDYSVEAGKENNKETTDLNNENKVQLIGKIAKLPKGIKASKGLNFMENVKIPKSSIWYILVEKQSNELQMLKYNLTKGVDLSKFINELKMYYTKKFAKNAKLVKLIESIDIDGNNTYSCIKNIPHIELEGKKMISIITEDLIKLLSK